MKGGGDELGVGIGIIARGYIVKGVFDLVKEAFDQFIGILGGLESDVFVLEVGFQDTSLIRINLLMDVAHGYI